MPGTGVQLGKRPGKSLHPLRFCLIEADSTKMPGMELPCPLFNLKNPSLHLQERGNVEKNRREKIPFPDRIIAQAPKHKVHHVFQRSLKAANLSTKMIEQIISGPCAKQIPSIGSTTLCATHLEGSPALPVPSQRASATPPPQPK